MCIVATSESGHGGRFEPCEEYKRMKKEYAATTLSLCEANKDRRDDIERLEAENAVLRQERDRLAGIVEKQKARITDLEEAVGELCE